MPFLGINPNSVSAETKAACVEILYPGLSDVVEADLTAKDLAEAFNIVDPEVAGLTASDCSVSLRFLDESDDD